MKNRTLRLPDELDGALRRGAAAANMSVQAWILLILKDHDAVTALRGEPAAALTDRAFSDSVSDTLALREEHARRKEGAPPPTHQVDTNATPPHVTAAKASFDRTIQETGHGAELIFGADLPPDAQGTEEGKGEA